MTKTTHVKKMTLATVGGAHITDAKRDGILAAIKHTTDVTVLHSMGTFEVSYEDLMKQYKRAEEEG